MDFRYLKEEEAIIIESNGNVRFNSKLNSVSPKETLIIMDFVKNNKEFLKMYKKHGSDFIQTMSASYYKLLKKKREWEDAYNSIKNGDYEII